MPLIHEPTLVVDTVQVPAAAATRFLEAAVETYESLTAERPYPCFAVLVGELRGDVARVERVQFGRNIRPTDRAVIAEFAQLIAPCFGAAYRNRHRGFWCDSGDLLRIARSAEVDGLDVLGSVHMHPDWHNLGPPAERTVRLSELPTPMDSYLFRNTGWIVNVICYLERCDGTYFHTWAGWSPYGHGLREQCRRLPVRLEAPLPNDQHQRRWPR